MTHDVTLSGAAEFFLDNLKQEGAVEADVKILRIEELGVKSGFLEFMVYLDNDESFSLRAQPPGGPIRGDH